MKCLTAAWFRNPRYWKFLQKQLGQLGEELEITFGIHHVNVQEYLD